MAIVVVLGKCFVLVADDNDVRTRVELEASVKIPVHWTDVEGEGSEVGLADDGFGKVVADVLHDGEVDGVAAEFGDEVFPTDDDLLSAVLQTTGVGGRDDELDGVPEP